MSDFILCKMCGSRKLHQCFEKEGSPDKPYKLCKNCRALARARQNKIREQNLSQSTHVCQCGKKFESRFKLNAHLAVAHDGSKTCECSQCDKKYALPYELARHIKATHDGVKDHICEQCGIGFADKSNLMRHITSIHDKIKNFECMSCNTRFTALKNLESHIKAIHDQIKDYECSDCTFKTSRKNHLIRHIETCTGGERKISSGEYAIRGVLETLNVSYQREMRFLDCKNINTLPFDFYLQQHSAVIEFDGRQHFEPIEYFGGQEMLERTQYHDAIKNAYCTANNIRLLRIKYTEFERIEELITDFLQIRVDTQPVDSQNTKNVVIAEIEQTVLAA